MNWQDYPVVFGCYRGTSITSRLIRWFTWSQYGHVAIYRRDRPAGNQIVESWRKGVVTTWAWNDNHTPGTPVELYAYRDQPEPAMVDNANTWLDKQVGKKYDLRGIIRFVARCKSHIDNRWFCSELAQAYAIECGCPVVRKEPYKVAPCDFVESPLLVKVGELRGQHVQDSLPCGDS